ncbi:MAG: hypothetical protein V1708_03635 [Candidatus Micrarchaeota archaeon]
MRYKPAEWGAVALLMRDSTYKVLQATHKEPRSWSELVVATGLTEPGLSKVLKEMKAKRIVAEVPGKSPTGAPTKRYGVSPKARELRIYETAKALKKKLDML